MPTRRPRPYRESLRPEDLRLAKQIEELYGPTRWKWGEWSGAPQVPAAPTSPPPMRKNVSALSLALRTLPLLALAVVLWYVAVGDRDALGQALDAPLRALGVVQPTSAPAPTVEYLLALQTLRVGEEPTPSEITVGKLRDLLDAMAPKCIEDRVSLARAVLAAHDTMAARGVEASAVSILTQANAALSDQARQRSPTNCADTLDRIARAR